MPTAPPLTDVQRESSTSSAPDLREDVLREVKCLLARHITQKVIASVYTFADEQLLSPEDTGR